MDGPPSFTAAIARNSDQQQSHVIEPYHFEEHHYIPSMSEIRSMEESNPDLSIEGGSVPREMVQPTETYNDGSQPVSIGSMAAVRGREIQYPPFSDQLRDTSEQAPSIGSMARDGGNSQTAGGNFDHNALLPSYNDVAPRDPSYTGESGGGQNLPQEGNYEGVTLNGRDFAKVFPKMFLNEDDQYNPYRL